MKAEDLELRELVDFEPGNINLYGRRLVLHSIHAFGQFRRDLMDMLGWDNARRVFTRFGFFWGQADAATMKRILEWDNPIELIKAGPRIHAIVGITVPEVKVFDIDMQAGRFHMEVEWNESGEAEEHLRELGWADQPVCWKLVGYASGYASLCMDKNVYFIEDTCRAEGDNICHAIGKDIDSWGEEITPYLPYFEAEDIKGNIEKLSEDLHRKENELKKQKMQLDLLGRKRTPFFIEGRSKALEKVLILADRVSQFDSSVLITGETGVGKEVLARFIHLNSHRSDGPFVAINCGSLPESLLESELFGHKKGSFTGAIHDRIGLFEQAVNGTIFMDEIGDISPAMQIRILRVLQEKEIVRIGENKPRKIDVRIISATNLDLNEAVRMKKFRDDLLYRLEVIQINIPPLRQRKEDILPLARFIIDKLSRKLKIHNLRFDSTCVDLLLGYDWPGNVRELENVLERGAVLSDDGVIKPHLFPQQVIEAGAAEVRFKDPVSRSLAQLEKEHIGNVLKANDGNRTRTANVLGISHSTLWRKMKEYGYLK